MKNRGTIALAGAAAVLALTGIGSAALGRWQSRTPAAGMSVAAHEQVTPGALQIIDKKGQAGALCPLKHTDVVADIAGYVSRVTVTQEFGNPSREPVEAIYTLPLPEDAAVDDMTMVIGKRIVKGVILRREDARQVYEEAKAQGRAAALLDQERPNIFTQSVANIMPGEQVKITISYVNVLKYEEGRYEFSFPMVVGPRFNASGGYKAPGQRGAPSAQKVIYNDPGNTSVVTDAEKITPPIAPKGTRAGHDISVTVNLDAGLPLQEVKSALHQVTIKQVDRGRAVVTLKDQQTIPNKDFVLRYTAAGSQMAEGILAYAPPGGKGGYFTLVIQPPIAPPQTMVSPKEMVFVIDQTGSQGGWPIKKSKETMAYCMKNLNPGDTFQLIGFNTEVFPCFDAPVPATKSNIEKALKWLEPIEGRGGTDILKSADYALKIPNDPGRLRIVCYMTDGYVGNDMQIIDYVGKHRGQARMFPFGIGNSVNRFLIEGIAREGKGASDYVFLDAPGTDHAAKFYRRIASPLLLDVNVDWGDLAVKDVYPRYIPDVFTSKPVIVKGRYTEAGEGDIVLRGVFRGQPWSRTIHVKLPAVDTAGSAMAAIWARERIEDLQNQDWVGAQTGNPKPEIKDSIIDIALKHRLMTQYTSFVAVEQRVVNVGGKQRTVDVPVEMPEGVSHEGIFGADKEAGSMMGQVAQNQWFMTPALRTAAPTAGGMGGGGYGGNTALSTMAVGKASGGRPVASERRRENLARGTRAGVEVLSEHESLRKDLVDLGALAAGEKDFAKKLAQMKPEDRRTLLRTAKLSEPLRKKLASGAKSTVEVQIWLNSLPADGMAKLKAAGFAYITDLRKGKLILGTVRVQKLDAILALPFVRAIEEPRMK